MITQAQRLSDSVENVILIGYGGSHAHGTTVETSDIDLTGIALNPKSELLGVYEDFGKYMDSEYDSIVYSLKRAVQLLLNCNPSILELLGLRECDYQLLTEKGKLLVDNRKLFISNRVGLTYKKMCKSQSNLILNGTRKGKVEILKAQNESLRKAIKTIKVNYPEIEKGSFVIREEKGNLYFDASLKGITKERALGLLVDIGKVKEDFESAGSLDDSKISQIVAKSCMHLIRSYMTGIDILKYGDVITYRTGQDHDLLMEIRQGHYLGEDGVTPTKDFNDMVAEYDEKIQKAYDETKLLDNPDIAGINELVMYLNS